MLILGQFPTTALHKRLAIIFLWEEFYQRDPIPIFNSLFKSVCIFGEQWGAHSYSYFPKYNRITKNFQNGLLLLVLTCWQSDDKLNVGFKKLIDECSFDLIVDSHWHVLFLTYWQTHIKWRLVMIPKLIIIILFFPVLVWSKLENELYIFLWLVQKLWDKLWETTHKKLYIKYKIIIIVQYTISEYVAFVVQHCENIYIT